MSKLIFHSLDSYTAAQLATNARKIDSVFACELEMQALAADVAAIKPRSGCCHGARNGWEIWRLNQLLRCDVVGTDIAPTAWDHGLLQLDFHQLPGTWADRFDFVYSNSLDHAHAPLTALTEWVRTLRPGGRIYVSHSKNSTYAQNEADCFGASLTEYCRLVQSVTNHLQTIWLGDCHNASGGIVKDLALIVAEKPAA